MRRRMCGITLIEIAVGLAVLAILASLAVPGFSERIARQRLATSAEMLALDFAEARFEAARSGQTLHLVFAPGADWCYAVARSPGCDCHTAQACQLKAVRAADAPGVTLSEGRNASFDPAGVQAEGGAAVLTGVKGEHRLDVGLSALGRPRICSPTGLRGYAGC